MPQSHPRSRDSTLACRDPNGAPGAALWIHLLALSAVLLVPLTRAEAGELSVLAGYQFNDEFVVTDDVTTDLPPGEPGQPGETIDVDSGDSAAIALDLNFGSDPNDRVGLFYSTHSTDIGAEAGLDQSGLRISYIHFTGTKLYDMGSWSGFAVAGLGATVFEPDDRSLGSSTEFSMQVGAGALIPLTKRLMLRVDARWIPTFTGTGIAGICSGGCVIAVESDLYHQVQVNAGIALRF